jgi:hypothetical protein
MDVFQLVPKRHPTLLDFDLDLSQPLLDLTELLRSDQTLLTEHSRMSDRATNVLTKQTMIKADAFAKSLQPLVAAGFKNSTA